MTYNRPIPVERIVTQIGDRAQINTQSSGRRPYGVGLLVAGIDDTGPHLFEFQPSGMTQEMLACAIGARSQMARTYLERHLDQFADASKEDLVKHALRALRESLPQDKELTVENTSVGIIGKLTHGKKKLEGFNLFDGLEVGPVLEASLESTEPASEGTAVATTTTTGESMEVDE